MTGKNGVLAPPIGLEPITLRLTVAVRKCIPHALSALRITWGAGGSTMARQAAQNL